MLQFLVGEDMRRFYMLALLVVCSLAAPICNGAEVQEVTEYGVRVFVLQQDRTVVKVAPSAGLNAYSISVDGVEFLHQPESKEKLAGVSCGVPILYPTPNRVRGGKFSFGAKDVQFAPLNGRGNHIHGLVNRHAWQVETVEADSDKATLICSADFTADSPLGAQFPFAHKLRVQIVVKNAAVRWTYIVDNQKGKEDVPFGFALHPYFVYQGERARTFLTIPASHWMEAENQLPTGKLVPASELDYPMGTPFSLEATKFDDVFWGVSPSKSTLIDFRDKQRQIRIQASEHFTHLVVWTPMRPFFGIESQTCSTDAHNLHSSGKVEQAHLQVAAAGKVASGWVEYQLNAK